VSESSLTKRKRPVAFILKDGRRGFAVEYAQTTLLSGFTRFIDCSIWPEDQPEKLMEYATFDVPSELIESVSEAEPEAGAEEEEKPRRRRKTEG
jgi:hypothetical protein